ncbi:unnamed protein product [Heligmosomoides polygyrus]|uniref:MFS domain-containing protein n=1 Tax=Heligmosomoides polygyrus TaxID=6339 RepID=A0A183FQB5_HELPZ|nr:unnamed protein product [Heligmosomoides polygyrus]
MIDRHVVCLLALSVILSLSSIFQMGYANAYPNTAVNSFRTYLNESQNGQITEKTFTWVWSAVLNVYFIGFIAGSMIAVPLADHIGRKCEVLKISSIAHSCSAIYSLEHVLHYNSTPNRSILCEPLQESAPVSVRGLMSFNAEMAFVVTNMLGALAGVRSVLGGHLSWLVGWVPGRILCVQLCLGLRKRDLAEKSVHFYHGMSYRRPKFSPLMRRKLRKRCCTKNMCGLDCCLVCALAPNQRLSALKTTLQATTSIWPILYYSTEFLIRANIDEDTAELTSTVMLFVSCISTVIGMVAVERQPRRRLLLGCGFVNMSALALFVLCSQLQPAWDDAKYGCIVAVVLHGISYSFALGPISWFITAELVPLEFRALCQSVALSLNQTIALILCFVTLPLYDEVGSSILLALFVVPGLMAMFYLLAYLPETRSRNIDEIIMDLKGRNKSTVEMSDQADQL